MEGILNYQYLVKIKMVGNSAVGKSSIITRFVDDRFSSETNPTIGMAHISNGLL